MLWIPTLLSTIGSAISGWFGAKTAKIDALGNAATAAIDLIKSSQASDAQKEMAIAQVVSADSNSESFLARNWRPAVSCLLWGMVFAMFMGYHPSAFDNTLTPTMEFILETARGCLFGYMPLRSVDKWVAMAYKSKMFEKIVNSVTK